MLVAVAVRTKSSRGFFGGFCMWAGKHTDFCELVHRPFGQRDLDGRIVAVQLAWLNSYHSDRRSTSQNRRLGSGESTQHHINTTPRAPINSGIMVLWPAEQTAIAKSRLLKARKIQQLQLQKRFLRLKLRLFGAVAHHLAVDAS